jgi:hypothetical protein
LKKGKEKNDDSRVDNTVDVLDEENDDETPTLKALDSEDQIDDQIKKFSQHKRPVGLFIKGLDIPDKDRKRLESEIQRMVTTEIQKHEQAMLKEAEEEKRRRQSRSKENKINISLEGLNLPYENRKRLESEIQQMVTRQFVKSVRDDKSSTSTTTGAGQLAAAASTCICAFNWLPGRRWYWPINYPFSTPYPHFLSISSRTGGLFGDYNLISVRIDNRDFYGNPIPQDQAIIGLKLGSGIKWHEKEILAYNACHGTRNTLHRYGGSPGVTVYTTIYDACFQTDTLVFRKPRTLGIWVDVLHLDPYSLWRCVGGKRVTFTWEND